MKLFKSLPIVLLLGISSCGGTSPSIDPSVEPSVNPSIDPSVEPSIEPSKEEETINYELSYTSTLIRYEGKPYLTTYTYPYKDSYFDQSSLIYSKDLALFSFLYSMETTDVDSVNNFFETLGFDNIYLSPDYETEDSKDNVKYSIAHKKINGTHVVVFASPGRDYKKAWENNFLIDREGNAGGFIEGADRIVNTLLQYIEPYKNEGIKFFGSGYSRGGGLVGLAVHNLLKNHSDIANDENTYCYTFESPMVVCNEDYMEHPSIYSIYNSGDPVGYLPPEAYGFSRLGYAIDLRNDNMDEICFNYNEKTVLSPFVSSTDFSDEEEFIYYCLNLLMTPNTSYESEGIYDISTRELYADYMQDKIAYFVSLFFTIKSETLTDIVSQIKDKALSFLVTDGLYNFLKEIFDNHGEEYDDTRLRESCNYLVSFIMYITPGVVTLALNEEYLDALIRSVQLHAPEVILPLLLALEIN